jgi:hypothetical protein
MTRRSSRQEEEPVSTMTAMEAAVHNHWITLPYHGYGICANPNCERPSFCCGVNPVSRICIDCFEHAYKMRPPNMKKRRKKSG